MTFACPYTSLVSSAVLLPGLQDCLKAMLLGTLAASLKGSVPHSGPSRVLWIHGASAWRSSSSQLWRLQPSGGTCGCSCIGARNANDAVRGSSACGSAPSMTAMMPPGSTAGMMPAGAPVAAMPHHMMTTPGPSSATTRPGDAGNWVCHESRLARLLLYLPAPAAVELSDPGKTSKRRRKDKPAGSKTVIYASTWNAVVAGEPSG